MHPTPDPAPLCVDLDGTLTRTDTLWESFALFLREQPLQAWRVPLWLLRGRAALKQELAQRTLLDPATLPWNEDFLAWLEEQRKQGRSIRLATAADRSIAERIVTHLDLDRDFLASDGITNLKGEHKLSAIQQRFGKVFDYAGDSSADLPVWQASRQAIVVNASASTLREAQRIARVQHTFGKRGTWLDLIRLLRPHQWIKNLLIFVPLLTSHQLNAQGKLLSAISMLIAFSCCASAIYILNDLLDLPHDRVHPKKRRRPLASGAVPILSGLLCTPLLLGVALLAVWPSLSSLLVLAAYCAASISYSFFLKRINLLDVFTLAGLYTMRIAAGSVATMIPVSPWLLTFSIFIFLSLAFCKRASELLNLVRREGNTITPGRGYQTTDLTLIQLFGVASGFASTLVLTLYFSSPIVGQLYREPAILWLLFPVFQYWIARVWVLTGRGEMNEDPIVFAFRDVPTYWMLLLCGIILGMAKWGIVPVSRLYS
jgi:4-hydroxybenzoate polyprenyltransferase/phosphoserine phosphatase